MCLNCGVGGYFAAIREKVDQKSSYGNLTHIIRKL